MQNLGRRPELQIPPRDHNSLKHIRLGKRHTAEVSTNNDRSSHIRGEPLETNQKSTSSFPFSAKTTARNSCNHPRGSAVWTKACYFEILLHLSRHEYRVGRYQGVPGRTSVTASTNGAPRSPVIRPDLTTLYVASSMRMDYPSSLCQPRPK